MAPKQRSYAAQRSVSAASLLAPVVALALLLTGCGAVGAQPSKSGSEQQAHDFAALYKQTIKWTTCDEGDGLDDGTAEALDEAGIDVSGITCAFVKVPFDWEDPTIKETVDLSVVHIPSTGKNPRGTLLGNPGGPGATGVGFMLGMAVSPGFEDVVADYDLLGFDPRGIGRSTPIDCDGAGSEIPAVQLGECIAKNPLTHTMGTSQVARDMELLRHLSGDSVLNYIGYSYGTMLGATYTTLFPERAGRMVLDSAEDAQWASLIHNFDQQVAISKATVALATACRTEYKGEVSVCPFTDEESLIRVLNELDAKPLVASDGTEINGQLLQSYLTNALYESHFERGRTLDTIALALFGNQKAIDTIGEGFADDGSGVDLAMNIVTCHSFPIEPDVPGLLKHIDKVGMPKLLGGPEINDETLAPFVDLSCYTLPESGLDITDRFSAKGADPILVIGITGDHATPFQYAKVLADELGARLLTLDGQGHAASYSGRSTCVDDAVTRYLVSGDLPAKGTVCRDD
ncbi:alpha/beta hydrolase [Leucobacter coleopterorum]|uniref:Alpha/beta hydrolase n=1 Tax=Leucobacter coleopterorum TaxID=2714933 RepID=A0ABX6JYU4_9MICO|nr:alpha/beta hydrolase [Leucobacter coleopterorum]QIM19495.1 alpha/beta hydrolase [Leucobacter coleopterorum]